MDTKKINHFLGISEDAVLSRPEFWVFEKKRRIVVVDAVLVIFAWFTLLLSIPGTPMFPPILVAPLLTFFLNFIILRWFGKRARLRGESDIEYGKAISASIFFLVAIPSIFYLGLSLFLLPFGY